MGETKVPEAVQGPSRGDGARPGDRARRGARAMRLYLMLAGAGGFLFLWFFFENYTSMKVATAALGAFGGAVFAATAGLEVASLVSVLRARIARRGGRLLDAERLAEFACAASPRPARSRCLQGAREAARMPAHAVFENHSGPVAALAFSPSGDRFATAGEDGRVVVMSAREGAEVSSACFDSPVTALAFRPDGKVVAVGTRAGQVHTLGAEDGATEVAVEQGFGVVALGFAPDDRLVAASTASGMIYLPRGEAKPMAGLNAGGEDVTAATFDLRTERFVAGTSSGSITVWDVRGEPTGLARLMQGGPVRSAALSADGRLLVTCGDKRPFLWQVAPFRRIAALDVDEDVFGVAFAPGAESVLAGTGNGVLCFSTSGGMAGLRAFTMDARRVVVVGMSPDGRILAAGTADGKVGIWRLADS